MNSPGSVTLLIHDAAQGKTEAVGALWQRYFEALVRLIRSKWGDRSRRVFDEEDIAVDVFDSFVRGARDGRFTELKDREGLWSLLVVIATHKVVDAWRRLTTQRTGGGDVRGESVWFDPADENNRGIEQVLGAEPTPALAAEIVEEMQRYLDLLGSEELRDVARLKMEGYTNAEIAVQLSVSERAVERRLNLIRALWKSGGVTPP